MTTITATIRNGRVEPDQPVNLPDGARVFIVDASQEPEFINEADWPDTPENRAELLRRLEAIQPLGWTAEEEARINSARQEWKRYNVEAMRKQMGLDQ